MGTELKVTDWTQKVYSDKTTKGQDRLVLITISTYADHEGKCRPSMATIANLVNEGIRPTWSVVERLIKAGKLEVEEAGVGRSTNLYRITL